MRIWCPASWMSGASHGTLADFLLSLLLRCPVLLPRACLLLKQGQLALTLCAFTDSCSIHAILSQQCSLLMPLIDEVLWVEVLSAATSMCDCGASSGL